MTPFPRSLTLKKRSQQNERRAAAEIGGRVQPASGAIVGMKGDVKSDTFLLEDKMTDKASFSITLPLLEKAEKEALISRRKALFRTTLQGKTFYTMSARTFQYLLNEHNK